MKKIFTLIATALMTMGASAQGTFAVVEDAVPTDGDVVTSVENITMTYGTANFKENKVDTKLTSYGFSCYTQGQNNPSFDESGIPTGGTYYKFEPAKNGVLKVGAVIGNGKEFFVMKDGENMNPENFTLTDYNGNTATLESNMLSEKLYGIVEVNVVAGSTYYMYMKGSKMSLYGFIYEVTAGGDEPGDNSYILSEVEPGVFAVTMTQEEINNAFDATWVEKAWNIGVALPAETVMAETEDITIKAAVEGSPVYTANGKLTDMQKEFPSYTGYINLGSTLANTDWTGEEVILAASEIGKSGQAVISVTPKKDGVLKFGVYAGNNSRAIGIFRLATEEDIENDDLGGWVSYNNFRHDTTDPNNPYKDNGVIVEDGVNNAPAYVAGELVAGREYLLIGGGSTNLTLHQITFTAGATSGISDITTGVQANPNAPVYNIAGQRVSAPVKGQIYIQNGKKFIQK